MIAQIKIPSLTADESRSDVTAPPILIPGIHLGSSIIGNVKSVVPGMGTPIKIPINVRTNKIQSESLIVQEKLLPHGASSRNQKTKPATAPTHRRVSTVL
jgi:predicted ATP-grasp superfamily ATP-dependent carboligase